jgi:hypothetical protein
MMPVQRQASTLQETTMRYETLARNAGFALAALATVIALGITVQYRPGLVR